MRQTRTAQMIIFDFYAPHERGSHLKALSTVLDESPQILALVEKDLIDEDCERVGRKGLSVDSVFHCLVLKQKFNVSYETLSFQLLDSPTLRSFARLEFDKVPSKPSLQGNIKRIKPQTLESIFALLNTQWQEQEEIDLSQVRIDSTVVKSNIAHPSDSKLLDDGVRVMSLFEEHTDIIIKGQRDVDYGHKINLASDKKGLLTCLSIEDGNPSDIDRYVPMIEQHGALCGCIPHTAVTDGGYASTGNLQSAKGLGVKRAVFHKRKALTLTAMGVKKKTFKALRDFRAGIEGNISELKRVFGLSKALWKSHDGFKAYVWSSALCYNLTRMARIRSG
jgi:IS5 family transposase